MAPVRTGGAAALAPMVQGPPALPSPSPSTCHHPRGEQGLFQGISLPLHAGRERHHAVAGLPALSPPRRNFPARSPLSVCFCRRVRKEEGRSLAPKQLHRRPLHSPIRHHHEQAGPNRQMHDDELGALPDQGHPCVPAEASLRLWVLVLGHQEEKLPVRTPRVSGVCLQEMRAAGVRPKTVQVVGLKIAGRKWGNREEREATSQARHGRSQGRAPTPITGFPPLPLPRLLCGNPT